MVQQRATETTLRKFSAERESRTIPSKRYYVESLYLRVFLPRNDLYSPGYPAQKRGEDLWQVHLYDPMLYKYVPDGELVFTAEGRLLKPRTLQHALAEQLVECISEANSAHLKEGGRN